MCNPLPCWPPCPKALHDGQLCSRFLLCLIDRFAAHYGPQNASFQDFRWFDFGDVAIEHNKISQPAWDENPLFFFGKLSISRPYGISANSILVGELFSCDVVFSLVVILTFSGS